MGLRAGPSKIFSEEENAKSAFAVYFIVFTMIILFLQDIDTEFKDPR